MTIDEKIKAALDVFGDPVVKAVYQGDADRYYTIKRNTVGTDYADDEPQHELSLVQAHLFAPLSENISSRIRETQRALFAAGLTWPSTEDLSDENGRHIVFECEDAEGVEVYG